ncbi:MAG: hypothetical protein H6739_07120 [Alphaproteobacteria bacterium]|nr:hypothetical protein [Alphaproteobacteria bacterium]
MIPRTLRLAVFIPALAVACQGPEDDNPVGIPPVDSDDTLLTDDSSGFPIDTSPDSGFDLSPNHTLTIEQWGEWELSPFGGPYTALVGELRAWEYLDSQRPPEDSADTGDYPADALLCDVTFSLVGAPSEEACAGCDFTFDVDFYLVDGNPDDCRDPDMPAHGDTRRYGFSSSAEQLLYDFGDAGQWLPWWDAWRAGDSVYFQWVATLGIAIEDDEEDE